LLFLLRFPQLALPTGLVHAWQAWPDMPVVHSVQGWLLAPSTPGFRFHGVAGEVMAPNHFFLAASTSAATMATIKSQVHSADSTPSAMAFQSAQVSIYF
jgi:hypothetical protein